MMSSNPRLLFPAVMAAALALLAHAPVAGAEGRWAAARTENFHVVCEAGEAEAAAVARRLEQFRAAFARVLPAGHFDDSARTVVVVFRDASSYAPFKPQHASSDDVAGHFQPGREVNYVVLAGAGAASSTTLLHEYTHLLVNNYFGHAPLWFKEGVAEFYGTARLSADGRRLTLGAAPRHRARALRARGLLPLAALLAADAGSAHYFDPNNSALFYAQSWALVHHLAGEGAAGRARLTRYLELLSEGAAGDEAFAQAFGAGVRETEAALARHVLAANFREQTETLAPAVIRAAAPETRALSRAEVLAHLGDLLARSDRLEAAEGRLGEAAALDSGLAAAQTSLGFLRLKQGRHAEAREHLQRAAAAAPRDHLAHFYLGEALHREGLGLSADDSSVTGFEEKTRMVRAVLRRALELAPDFVETYRLLAVVELDRAGRAEESVELLNEALRRAPRRADLRLLLAQARLGAGEFDAARAEAAAVERGGDPFLRGQARRVAEQIEAVVARVARLREREEEAARLEEAARVPTLPCDLADPGPQRKPLRFAGQQACGRLVQIECETGDGVVLHVETGERVLRLRAEAINSIKFVTYTAAVKSTSRITCGPRDPANFVLVTYRARRADPAGLDGDASAVEFIPPDWNQ